MGFAACLLSRDPQSPLLSHGQLWDFIWLLSFSSRAPSFLSLAPEAQVAGSLGRAKGQRTAAATWARSPVAGELSPQRLGAPRRPQDAWDRGRAGWLGANWSHWEIVKVRRFFSPVWDPSSAFLSPLGKLAEALCEPDEPFFPWGCSGCTPGLRAWAVPSQPCPGSCRFVGFPTNSLSLQGIPSEGLSAGWSIRVLRSCNPSLRLLPRDTR